MSDPTPEGPPLAAEDSKAQDLIMKIVPLARLPTLTSLYQSKALYPVKYPLYPHHAEHLDRVALYQGDITRIEVDGIVNAANRHLLGGGGVDGAIHDAAGYGLLKECETLGGAETGEVKITGGYKLPAKHVLHAVGPIYSPLKIHIVGPQLSNCYRRSLDLAVDKALKTIAFCSLSTGIYGYPIREATRIALETTRKWLDYDGNSAKLDRVIFVVWSDKDKEVYEELIPEYFPPNYGPEDGVAPAGSKAYGVVVEEPDSDEEPEPVKPQT